MSSLTPKEEDIKNLILGCCHLGTKVVTKQMRKYVYKIRADGVAVLDVNKIYEKIQVAARIIASVDPESIVAISGRPEGQRAIYKFAHYTHCSSVNGRWSPGSLTNQTKKKFMEPRLLIVTDPRVDYNALVESTYVNIPVIAICNTDNSLKYVDCAIPSDNRSAYSIAMIWYLLTKAVMEIKQQSNQFDSNPSAFVNTESLKKEDQPQVEEEGEGAGDEEEPEDNKEDEGGDEEGEGEGDEDGDEKFTE